MLALWVGPFLRERSRKVGPQISRILSSPSGHLKDGKRMAEAMEGRRQEA